MDTFPKFTAAAVQAAPEFLDATATVKKAVRLIHEAASNGASLVAFPEAFIAGYPYWAWTMNPVKAGEWFERFYKDAAIDVPGPHINTLREAAAATGTTVVIGVNERGRDSVGTVYNSMVTIGAEGALLSVHRKLVPTWAEKLVYTPGDGAGLRVLSTEVGPLGGLICGENTNTLARYALLAQGELVHVASYVAIPVAPTSYDMASAIAMRTSAHSFEGKLFSVVACAAISEEIIDMVAGDDEEVRHNFKREHSALSGVFGPDGHPVSETIIDAEGIVYGEIDLSKCIAPKQMHDIVGHYNRFDVFDMRIDRSRRQPARFFDVLPAQSTPATGPWTEAEAIRGKYDVASSVDQHPAEREHAFMNTEMSAAVL